MEMEAKIARLEERMGSLEGGFRRHEEHCYQFRSDTRKEQIAVRSLIAGLYVMIAVCAGGAAAAVIYFVR